MSPLWRDELRIVLAPEHVALVRLVWTFGRRGLVRHVAAKSAVDCPPEAGDGAPWEAPIRTLDTALPRMVARKSVARVILSNHFMRYALMPWSEKLSDAAEEEAYSRHCFRQLYGALVDNWELRLSQAHAGLPQLASAVDTRLLAALRGTFERHGVELASIQPHLMAAYNNCRPSLRQHSGWFVLYEPGCLFLALLQHGSWASVRTMRVGSDWRDTLSLALERETYLVDLGDASKAVFLWAPELGKGALPESGKWQIHNLHPAIPPSFVPQYEGRFAVALSG